MLEALITPSAAAEKGDTAKFPLLHPADSAAAAATAIAAAAATTDDDDDADVAKGRDLDIDSFIGRLIDYAVR